MKWTHAQQRTIETRDKNILVSAAAGSGKTAVLIERIKRLVIDEKTDIDRFLITTFTNAASMEMKERLEKAIREQLKKDNCDKVFLKRQLFLMPRANISTFHTFALEVMRRYFYLTNLEPGFKIGDETEVSIMKDEAVDELFDIRFNEDYESFKKFLKKYSSDRNENKIKKNIISIYNEMRSIPDYMTWVFRRTELLNSTSPLKELNLAEFIAGESKTEIKKAAELYKKAADILEDAGIEGLYQKAIQDAELIYSAVEQGERETSTEEKLKIYGVFLTDIKFNQMRASKEEKEDYEQVKEQVTALRKSGKKLLDDIKKKFFQRSMKEYDEELREGYEDTMYFAGLLKQFEEIFKEKKSERNMVDFDDVMHYAIEILSDDMVAAEYREKFRYIFIDEFQDSNMLQETIVSRISRKDNLFMVGDVKQSIYKFRLAEPEIFKAKYELYSQSDTEDSIKIDLSNNFRSKLRVTKTVNKVFDSIMDGYDENARLICTLDEAHPGEMTECHIAPASFDEESGYSDVKPEDIIVSRLIKETVGKNIYDVKKGVTRKVTYKDIVVLSRSKSAITSMEKFLNNEGIPAYGETVGGYFETVEIQVFVNLLRIIDNTRRDIPLISAMRSPVFNFTVTEMAAVRIENRDGSFFNAVKEYAENGSDGDLKEKIVKMFERISYWKLLKSTVALDELVRILLYDTGYYDYCSGLPVGKQRASNLRMLVEKAGQFQQNNHSGLYGFISYIEAMKKSNVSVGEAKIAGENEDVVRVMTVHKSKGLEFPVVILTGMGRTIKYRGTGNSAAMHKDLALGLPYVNMEERWHRKTLLQRAIEAKKAKEEFEEEIRILYVALTRAVDKLILTGTVKEPEKLEEITGIGKSFMEMVYGPMKEAGEKIIIHYGEDRMYDEARRIAERVSMADVFSRIRATNDEDKMKAIDERLSFRYPYRDIAGIKSKYSVTQLNSRMTESQTAKNSKRIDMLSLSRPKFSIQKSGLTSAQIGTLMHLVMEKLDFKEAVNKGVSYIRQAVEKLTEDGTISCDEAKYIKEDNIEAFFKSNIGRRAADAKELYKEREFILNKEIEGAETIVQGIIDCYFEEDDGLVLIDYKNSYVDRVSSEAEIARRYRGQIDIYAEALEAACGKPVKEAYLYLFNLKKFISLTK